MVGKRTDSPDTRRIPQRRWTATAAMAAEGLPCRPRARRRGCLLRLRRHLACRARPGAVAVLREVVGQPRPEAALLAPELLPAVEVGEVPHRHPPEAE